MESTTLNTSPPKEETLKLHNMNKSLFETKQKSIDHYSGQINELNETINKIKEVKLDLVKSLVEFFPFQSGDIIINGISIIMVNEVKETDQYSVIFSKKIPDSNGGWKDHSYNMRIDFCDLPKWKKIN